MYLVSLTRTLALALLVAASLLARPAQAVPSHWIVFGDSLSDAGNLFSLTGALAPPSPPYAGKFSDGPVWTDHLAAERGLTVHNVLAPLDGGLAGDLHIDNFAVGGSFTTAYTLASPPFPPLAVGNANDLAVIAGGGPPPGLPGLVDQLGLFDLSTPPGAPADALYVVWAGANDLVFSDLLDLGGLAPGPTPGETIAESAAANVAGAVSHLASRGATRFLVPNLPDIGVTPFAAATGRTGELSAASALFNETLADLLAALALDIALLDIESLLNGVLSRPFDFGLTELGPCLVPGASALACTDPGATVFWDPLHPTSATHAILAAGFLEAAAPEPATAALLALPLLVLLGASRRRTAAALD